MPAVNFDLMLQAMRSAQRAKSNQIVYWSASAGLEEPDAHAKSRRHLSQAVLQHEGRRTDGDGDSAGRRRRLDHRQHRRWLAGCAGGCRPCRRRQGHRRKIPDPAARLQGQAADGYIALPSPTYQSYALLRSNLASGSDADVAKAVGIRQARQDLSAIAGRQSAADDFVDAIERRLRLHHPLRHAASFSRSTASCSSEPWIDRDRVMIDMLKSIGIEKGKPFKPDAKARKRSRQPRSAKRMHGSNNRYEDGLSRPPYNEGQQWVLPACPELMQGLTTNVSRDAECLLGRRSRRPGLIGLSRAAKHLGRRAILPDDDQGQGPASRSTGTADYRLIVPANAPVKQYWSATVYDRATHALIRDQP